MVQAGKAKGALCSGCGYHMLVMVSVSTHLEYAYCICHSVGQIPESGNRPGSRPAKEPEDV